MRYFLTFIFIMFAQFAHADISIASFNIKHLGWNNGKDLNALNKIISQFDLVAIQELMDEIELIKLEKLLEKETGLEWSSMASHPVGRSRYKEQYGFIWNENVSYETGAVVYIDDRDVFEREPMSLQFKSNITGKSFVLASLHVVFGDSVSDREYEIKALSSYWDWLGDVYPDVPRILAGDFNLPPSHAYFKLLRDKSKPLITSGKTTISKTEGRYVSLYDNLFIEKDGFDISGYGIYKFPKYLKMSHEVAHKTVSDHVPVYLTLGNKNLLFSKESTNYKGYSESEPECIDINSSSINELSKLSGVGDKRAGDIVSGRPWSNAEELDKINGIGPATLKKILNHPELCD